MSTLFDGIRTQCLMKEDFAKTGQVLSAVVAPGDLVKAVGRLWDKGYFLEDVSAIDTTDGLVVHYHFDHFTNPGRVTIRVIVDRADPKVPSISGVYTGADWHERECCDFHGVEFTGHPHLVPLLLPAEDADLNPLRKSDKARKGIGALLLKGEVITCAPAVEELFTPPAAEGDAAEGEEG